MDSIAGLFVAAGRCCSRQKITANAGKSDKTCKKATNGEMKPARREDQPLNFTARLDFKGCVIVEWPVSDKTAKEC